MEHWITPELDSICHDERFQTIKTRHTNHIQNRQIYESLDVTLCFDFLFLSFVFYGYFTSSLSLQIALCYVVFLDGMNAIKHEK